jgi:hypothetical protein
MGGGCRDTFFAIQTGQVSHQTKSEARRTPVRNHFFFSAAAALAMLALSPVMHGQDASPQGHVPDISGVWQVTKYQPKMFPNGAAPLAPWGEAKFKTANPETNDPNLGCLPTGVPRLMFVPLPLEIVQTPARVVIIHEGVQALREIYLNRPHPKDLDPTFSGDSVGKWEGDTLVVDTIGFNDKTWLDAVGLPHSEKMHVSERIRRADHDTLIDDVTIDDPMAYTKPFTVQQVYKLKPGWEIQEYVCEENNKYTYQGK